MGLVNGEARRYLPKNAENSNASGENIPLSEYMQYGRTPEQAGMEARARREGERAQHGTLNEVIAANHDAIAQTGVLAKMTGDEFQVDKHKLVDKVTEFFNSIGNKVFRAGFGDVTLNRSGARDSISHGMGRNKAIAFSAVPEVIENGTIIDTQSNWKGRRYDTVTFGGQIQIGEQIYDMGVIVKKYDNADMASKYYLHEVILANEKGETMSFKTGTKMGYPSDTVSPDDETMSFKTGTREGYPSDTASPDNSISPNAENSNSSGENIPLGEYMQYGKTPEQAGMEARARREGERAQQQRAEKQEAETQTLIDAWNTARPIRDRIEDMRSKMNLTENDERVLQGSMLTGDTNGILKNANDPTAVLQLYQLEQQAREAMEPVRKYNAERRQRMELQAAEFAESIAEYATDKKRGLAYQTETPERNIYDIFGKAHRAEAERFIGEYLTPVHKAAAEGVRLQNGYRERVKALNLDKHESAMVQMIAEGERRAAEMYASEHGIKLDEAKNAKLNRAATEFRAIYSELMQKINEVEVKNGLEPTRVRRDYMPHFVDGKPDTLIAKAFYRLGMKITGKDTIPTDLAGVTEAFRPGHQWESHLQHRTGENTVYDAVRGFDQYIDTMADYLTQTDNIQKLRALEDAVRYRLSDEGTRAKIDEIKRDYTKDALARRQAMEDAYDADNQTTAFQRAVNEVVGQRDAGMRNFVTELRRYTDQLAGKKHRGDRGIEDMVGRDIYEISRNLEGRVAANMIALNPGSWLTNFIPITQAWGEVDAKHLLRGMAETVKSYAKDDGFVDTSAFLTNRHGSESIAKTTLRKISDKAGAPMEWIDHFVSDSIVRARTMQNMEKNRMDFSAAVDEADSFAAGLMADRSKGSMPGVFEMRNPLIKTFTMFQLEVNNQLRYLAKDLPRHMEGKSTAAAMAATGAALTKIFLGAFLFNAAYSQLTGRDSALDPIGMIADALGIGDDDDKERTGWDVAESLGKSVAENLPFVGGIIGGGRVPISSALPDMGNIWNAAKGSAATNKKAQTIGKELLKPAIYLLPPFGGGAANKIINGYQTVKAGGSYSLDSDGNRVLQFPAYGQTPLDYAKAMAFGKWSSKEAQQYVDSGFGGLNAKETAAYEELHSMGVSSRDAWAAVRGLDGFETVKDEDGKVVQSKKEQQRLALFDNDTLTAAQKEALDRALIVSGEDELPADYSDRTAFLLSQYVSDNRKSAARAALNTGLSIDQFRTWDGRMTETAREKDADGKSKFSTAEAAGRVLNEIQNDSTLKDSEKQAIADYVLISAMSDSVQEKWQEVRGKVNATDFVKFRAALADINKDGGTPKNDEITAAVEAVPGLTDEQRGYLWQSAKSGSTKNNPWGAETAKAGAVNPVEGGTLSSGFGLRQSFTTSNGASSSSNHKAIDIAAPAGTAVKAAMGGKIIAVTPGYNGGYGNTVEIDCGGGIVMKYHHMQDGSISGVSVGQEVSAGEQIGKVGSTGNSTGPHLDFQVVKDGDFVDPRNYIPGYGEGTAATISAAQDTSTSGGKRGGSGSGSGGLKKLEGLKKLPVFG